MQGGNSERHANLRRLGKVTSLSLESQHGQDGPHGQGQVARGPHTEHQPYKAMAAAHKPIMESGDDLLRSHHVDICDTDPDLADAPEEEFLSTGDLLDTEEDLGNSCWADCLRTVSKLMISTGHLHKDPGPTTSCGQRPEPCNGLPSHEPAQQACCRHRHLR